MISMNMDTIREWHNRQPFEPFVLRMSNGEVNGRPPSRLRRAWQEPDCGFISRAGLGRAFVAE